MINAFRRKREYLNVIRAYNWRNDMATYLNVERKNSDTFMEFLEKLLVKTYPTQVIILVMDNASYLYSAKIQATFSLSEHRVQVFWLLRYCPELNVIERFWLHLKQTAWANKLSLTRETLNKRILKVLQHQSEPSCSERLTFSKFFQ